MTNKPVGEVFEIDGKWYVIVDQGKKIPSRAERLYPQPTNLPEEYSGSAHENFLNSPWVFMALAAGILAGVAVWIVRKANNNQELGTRN